LPDLDEAVTFATIVMGEQEAGENAPLGFLLGRAARVMAIRIDRTLQEKGYAARLEHWVVLQQLTEGEMKGQGSFVELLGRDKTAVTRLMVQMEEEGWIRRHTDPKDRRNKCIGITENGLALHQELAPLIERIDRDVEEQLPPERLRGSKQLLEELFQRLKGELEHSEPR
jgi:MarR family transcriptional regulator for hemolysin